MNRRQILEQVAAGRLRPTEGARLLDQPAERARALRLRRAFGAIELQADPDVADLVVVDGVHRVVREGDVLDIVDVPVHGTWQAGRRFTARVNPELEVDAEITGGLLSVRGLHGPLRVVVQAGSAAIEGIGGPLELQVTSGSVVVSGSPRLGDWRLESVSASLQLTLSHDCDATVDIRARHSSVDAWTTERRAVLGSGTHSLDIDATFSDLAVRIE
ncbi:MAG TPA: hypothetical protein VFZ21_13745 [Gemmatimonadaceae bacterium]|nr:hypothetical protein [Gemmatimonadaceae bacterium]